MNKHAVRALAIAILGLMLSSSISMIGSTASAEEDAQEMTNEQPGTVWIGSPLPEKSAYELELERQVAERALSVENVLRSRGLLNASYMTNDLLYNLTQTKTNTDMDWLLDSAISQWEESRDQGVSYTVDTLARSETPMATESTVYWTATWTFEWTTGGSWMPCKRAYVELLNSNGQVVQTGFTNEAGTITFWVNPGSYNMRINIDDHQSNKVSVDDSSWEPWKSTTGYYNIVSNTNHPNHRHYWSSSADRCRCWAWYSNVIKSWDWIRTNTANAPGGMYTCPHVTTVYPTSSLLHSTPWIQTITGLTPVIRVPDICADRLMNDVDAAHEWAHAMMHYIRGLNMPPVYTFGPTSHCAYTEADTGSGGNWGFSWVEGWAEFLSCKITGKTYGINGDIEYGGDILASGSLKYSDGTGKVYADNPGLSISNGDDNDSDGWDVEGAVASALWDIADGIDGNDRPSWSPVEYRDGQPCWWNELWDVFRTNPNNMYDVWTRLNENYPVSNGYWWLAAFYNARMNPYNMYDI